MSVPVWGLCSIACTVAWIGDGPVGWMNFGKVHSPGRDSSPSSPAWGHMSPPVKQLSDFLQTWLCSGPKARVSVSYLLHPDGPAPRIVPCPGASLVFLCLGATPRPFYFGLVCMRFPSCPLDRSWYQWMSVVVCVACQSRQMVLWPFSAICAFLFLLDLRTWNEKRDKCPSYLKVLKIIRKRVLQKIRNLLINHLYPVLYVWCFQFSVASRFLF